MPEYPAKPVYTNYTFPSFILVKILLFSSDAVKVQLAINKLAFTRSTNITTYFSWFSFSTYLLISKPNLKKCTGWSWTMFHCARKNFLQHQSETEQECLYSPVKKHMPFYNLWSRVVIEYRFFLGLIQTFLFTSGSADDCYRPANIDLFSFLKETFIE